MMEAGGPQLEQRGKLEKLETESAEKAKLSEKEEKGFLRRVIEWFALLFN